MLRLWVQFQMHGGRQKSGRHGVRHGDRYGAGHGGRHGGIKGGRHGGFDLKGSIFNHL